MYSVRSIRAYVSATPCHLSVTASPVFLPCTLSALHILPRISIPCPAHTKTTVSHRQFNPAGTETRPSRTCFEACTRRSVKTVDGRRMKRLRGG